jgi:hypothetical protein
MYGLRAAALTCQAQALNATRDLTTYLVDNIRYPFHLCPLYDIVDQEAAEYRVCLV